MGKWGKYYGIIYKLTDKNKDNSLSRYRVYIGQTIRSLRDRFKEHLTNTENKFLREAINRYKKKFEIIVIKNEFLQTNSGEFTIEVVDYTNDFLDQNNKEKYYIKKYKSYVYDYYKIVNDKIIPLYGYNLERGGGAKLPVLKGLAHPLYVKISKSDFKNLIMMGYFTQEIANELNISKSTVNAKIKEFWSDQGINNINKARRAFGGWMAFKTRGHVSINLEQLIKLIEEGYHNEEIYKKLSVSNETVKRRLNQLGISNLNEARIIFGATDKYDERFKERRLEYQPRGEESYQFISIPEENLKKHIVNGMTAEQIAQLYNTTHVTIRNRINQFWNLSFEQARLLFKLLPRIDNKLLVSLINTGLTIDNIEVIFLKELISKGNSLKTIALLYELDKSNMINKISNMLGMKFNEARRFFYWKSRIKDTIKKGARNSQDIANLLSENRITVVNNIKEIWKSEFENLYDLNYPPHSPCHFQNLMSFLIHFYVIYPQIDNNLLEDCIYNDLNPKEIISKFSKCNE